MGVSLALALTFSKGRTVLQILHVLRSFLIRALNEQYSNKHVQISFFSVKLFLSQILTTQIYGFYLYSTACTAWIGVNLEHMRALTFVYDELLICSVVACVSPFLS